MWKWEFICAHMRHLHNQNLCKCKLFLRKVVEINLQNTFFFFALLWWINLNEYTELFMLESIIKDWRIQFLFLYYVVQIVFLYVTESREINVCFTSRREKLKEMIFCDFDGDKILVFLFNLLFKLGTFLRNFSQIIVDIVMSLR